MSKKSIVLFILACILSAMLSVDVMLLTIGIVMLMCTCIWLFGFITLLILTHDLKDSWKSLNPLVVVKSILY